MSTSGDLNRVLEGNIQKLCDQRRAQARRRSPSQRIADAIAHFAGSIPFIYIHVLIVGAWTMINLGWTPIPKFDPTFVILATVASVEAIFLSTFILISQNRMTREADERADLDLQISLLAEHEITRLIQLTTAIAARLEVQEAGDPQLDELKRDVPLDKVVEKIKESDSVGS
jgi:uncharacterized membrane protein